MKTNAIMIYSILFDCIMSIQDELGIKRDCVKCVVIKVHPQENTSELEKVNDFLSARKLAQQP
jgi:hypothetical protein